MFQYNFESSADLRDASLQRKALCERNGSTPWVPGCAITAALNPALLKTYSQTFFLYGLQRCSKFPALGANGKLPHVPEEKDFGADCSPLLPLILCPPISQLLVSGSHFCFVKQDVLHCPFLTDTSPSTLQHHSKMRGFHLSTIYCSLCSIKCSDTGVSL